MRKSGFHVQQTSNELREAIERVQPTLIVSLAHDYDFWADVKARFPKIFLVGRLYEDGQDWRDIDPRRWAERCAALGMPYDAFITFNEPFDIYNWVTAENAAWHDNWCCSFRRRALELGYQAVALNVPTGHGHGGWVARWFPDICQEFDYIGLHEYSARCMWDQDPKRKRRPEDVDQAEGEDIGYWYCQRYRDWYRAIVTEWPARKGKFELVVTECGIAMGVIAGYGDVGWKGEISEDQYLESLRWCFEAMNDDPYCRGGAIYMVGAADPSWASFETLPMAGRLTGIAEVPRPNGGDEMSDEIVVRDLEGKIRDFEYAKNKYGVAFRRAEVEPGKKVYRLVELWEKTGHHSLITQVLDEDGQPIPDMSVAFYWPDAPDPPKPPTTVLAHDWYRNFVHGLTNINGEVGPGMGTGAYHGEGEGGPHAVWVRDPNIPGDICEKLGMLAGTFHDHLDQKIQLMVHQGEGPSTDDYRELKKTFEEGPVNGIRIEATGRNFYGTRGRIGVKSVVVDGAQYPSSWEAGPFHRTDLLRYEFDARYTPIVLPPGLTEESRVFWTTIETPAGMVVGGPYLCKFETGTTGIWTIKVGETGGPPPPPPPPPAAWTMTVQREPKPGSRLLIGTGLPDSTAVAISAPGIPTVHAIVGQKGPGRFEAALWHAAIYTLAFPNETFTVTVAHDEIVTCTFVEGEPPPPKARLVSGWTDEGKAEELLEDINEAEDGNFEGIFTIQPASRVNFR